MVQRNGEHLQPADEWLMKCLRTYVLAALVAVIGVCIRYCHLILGFACSAGALIGDQRQYSGKDYLSMPDPCAR
jgi:hypothetical protein